MADSQASTAKLEKDPVKPACYQLTGIVDFSTITGLDDEFSRTLVGQKTVGIDLSKLVSTNTAGVAMLIHWVNLAQKNSVQLTLLNIPDQVRRLAQINGVDEVLG